MRSRLMPAQVPADNEGSIKLGREGLLDHTRTAMLPVHGQACLSSSTSLSMVGEACLRRVHALQVMKKKAKPGKGVGKVQTKTEAVPSF